jgi:4-amino-4-deoxy-L-arabinose transferase-like glycosyltransferase
VPFLAVASLLGLGLGLQLYFFRHYPQPPLFGDPAGYYNVGLRFQEAVSRLRAGEPLAVVFASVRGLFYLAGVGTVFGVLDALRPGDTALLRDVMALANTAAMLGVFVLARRLSGSRAGGLVALALAVGYATFSVQTGRLYPDPLTAALLVWAGAAYAGGISRRSRRRLAGAGGLLGLALLLRAQVLEYIVAVIALSLLATMRWWWRTHEGRALVAAFLIGLSPALVAWAGIRWAVGGRDDVVRMGQVTFRPTYPFGFWQQLETDGWTGPYRFKQDPFYKAMEAEARAGDPDLLRARGKQLAFTVRYVAARPLTSLLLVLDNAYRLYDRPANDYKWDYPYPYPLQVFGQRAIVVLGLAGAALLVAEQPALAGVFLIPIALAVLHGLVFPWPRYNVPAMPLLIASAGVFVVRAAADAPWRAPRARRVLLTVAAPAIVTLALAVLVRGALPEAARVGRVLGILLVLALPFVVIAIKGARWRRVAAAAGAALGILVGAHAVRDRRWHETSMRLGGDVAGVEQVIRLSPEALGRLRSAPEAFVLFDLTVPRGDLQDASITIGSRQWPGSALLPTMPRLRESTATGGRDRRGYPQWWALRLDPAALPTNAGEPLRIRLSVPEGTQAVLRGDRFTGQDREYEGPSFGDWPHYVALKIEYDGDYRLPVSEPLRSLDSESAVVRRSGEGKTIAAVHRIRVVVPGSNEGRIEWESAPAAAAGPTAFVFAAYSGTRGEAEMRIAGTPLLRFPLGARESFEASGGGWRLCHRAEPPRQDRAYGEYVLVGPAPGRAPLSLSVAYRAGLSQEPMFFVIDRRAASPDLVRAARQCGVEGAVTDGAARIIDGTRNNYPEDTGRWTVAGVF